MHFVPAGSEEAGITAVLNDRSAFVLALGQDETGNVLRLAHHADGERREVATAKTDAETLFLKVTGDYLKYQFYFSEDGERWHSVGGDVDGAALSPATVPGYNYTGVYLGLYASGNSQLSDKFADFEFFNYRPTAESRDAWFERQMSHESHP